MLSVTPFRTPGRRHDSGFTLVEMLVSVALVLLMMAMFSQIFVMATGSLSQQRAIAENDQRCRLLSVTLRGDLDRRSFRDVFPFRANEDTRQLGHSLSRRAGYFEIDEGNPADDTDDVLQFTALVNIKLQSSDGSPFTGRSDMASGRIISTIIANPSEDTIFINGDYTSQISSTSPIWIAGSTSPSGASNNGRYFPTSVTLSGPNTLLSFSSGTFNLLAYDPTGGAVAPWGYACLSESDPDFDDGLFANGLSISAAAEVCYFLRNGILYRRVLLIRDTPTGSDAQPTWSTGIPSFWNSSTRREDYPTTLAGSVPPTTFWRDYDFSAFYFNGKTPLGGGSPLAPGVHFHSANESLSNSTQSPLLLIDETASPAYAFPISLGIPHLRFGHNFTIGTGTFGMPQDASTRAMAPGLDGIYGNADDVQVALGRFTLQECANSAFGYPGYIPSAGNPFNRTNLEYDPDTGLVRQFSGSSASATYPGQIYRRGEDILMPNVLSFDIKVWDPNIFQYVDIGDDGARTAPAATAPTFASNSSGRLNRTYGGRPRFDTWHPLASVGNNVNDDEPPYLILDALSGRPLPLTSIQITINFRDISSNQVRQASIIQSLVDRTKIPPLTNEAPEE
jgi:prepilin-type N-terminal cleavage/methylation domain-containing protein